MPIDFDYCVKCTSCLSQCPVSAVNVLFDGPKRLGPDLARMAKTGLLAYPASAALCSNCKNCDVACPHGVGVSRLINLARGASRKKRPLAVRDRLLADPELTGRLVNTRLLRTAAGLAAGRAGGMFGLSPNAALLRGGGRSDLTRLPQKAGGRRVAYFPGCYVRFFEPGIASAVIRILNHFGFQVDFPAVHCCGLPRVANGFLAGARAVAEQNLAVLGRVVEEGLEIITTCPSCALMLRQEYVELFGLEKAPAVAAHVWDLFAFLGERAGLDPARIPVPGGRLAYHAPCHLRAAGTASEAFALFSRLEGLEMVDLDGGCCGQSGSYGFKAENYATAMAVGGRLFSRVREVAPDKVLTECGTCRIQIAAATGVTVEHPARLLADWLD